MSCDGWLTSLPPVRAFHFVSNQAEKGASGGRAFHFPFAVVREPFLGHALCTPGEHSCSAATRWAPQRAWDATTQKAIVRIVDPGHVGRWEAVRRVV